jgi:type 1 glutamine amidotransferase
MDADQPAIWTVDYGKGRVFAFTMGHDEISLGLAGIDALLLRGTEWAATGDVTMPLPSDAQAFPLN